MLHTQTGTLQPQLPFDFAQSLAVLGMFPPMHGEQQIATQTLTKAVSIERQPVVFRVYASGTSETPELSYTLFSTATMREASARAAADRIRFFLSLDDDLRPFYDIGEQDEAFAPVIRHRYGLHQVKFLTPFENACWAILSQRQPMQISLQVKRRITEQLGAVLAVDAASYHAFPEPETLLEAPEALAQIVNNPRKSDYLLAAARAFASRDEQWLRSAPAADVEAWLLGIKGIGAWSARFILIRGLGHMEYLPSGEARMLDAARAYYGRSLTDAQITEISAKYGAYRGYWAYYLRNIV